MSNEHQTNVNSALADWHGSILSGSALHPAFLSSHRTAGRSRLDFAR